MTEIRHKSDGYQTVEAKKKAILLKQKGLLNKSHKTYDLIALKVMLTVLSEELTVSESLVILLMVSVSALPLSSVVITFLPSFISVHLPVIVWVWPIIATED